MQSLVPSTASLPTTDTLSAYAESFVANQGCENTQSTYQQEISLFYRAIGKRADMVSLHDLIAYKETLTARELKPATIAKKLTVLRRLFTFLYEQGVIATNPSAGVKLPRVSNETTRDELSLAECNRLLASIETGTIQGKRDKAICALLLINGLRLCEITRANIGDLVEVDGYHVLRVRGKVAKNMDVRIREDVYTVLQAYLQSHSEAAEDAPLFVGTTHRAGQRLARRSVQHMIRTRLTRAGMQRSHISCHSLRHSSITNLINAGATLLAAADFARHSSPVTTQRYFHNLERLKNAPVLLQPVRV